MMPSSGLVRSSILQPGMKVSRERESKIERESERDIYREREI